MPPLALGLVLVSAVLHASWNLLIARSPNSDVITAVAVPLGGLIFLPFALPTWRIEAEAWPYLIVSMGLELLYLTLLAAAYGRADLSLVYPLARGLAPVIVLVFGIVALGLTTNLGEVAGVLAVGAGVLLVRGVGRGLAWGSPGPDDRVGTLLALAVAATIATYTLVDRQGLRFASPTAYVVLALAVPGLVYLAIVARRRGRALVREQLRPVTAFTGVAMFAGYGAALAALTIAPPASVSAGRESSVVIATLMAAIVLKERVGPRRLAGSILVVAGVALLALA
ncbi:MAG: EamA family transporter [Candidatus Limnocylindrales bacterium]